MLRPDGLLGRGVRWVGHRGWARRFVGPRLQTPLDRAAHRLTGGRWRPADLLFDSLVLTTVGRRSGRRRSVPLAYFDLDGTPVVIASNYGREHHPAWSHNLLAHPTVVVEHRGRRRAVRARLLTPEEQERVWPQAVAIWPGYDTYRRTTEGIRDIRMFALEETDGAPPTTQA